MILIKDNHVDFAGGIKKAILAAQNYCKANGKNIPIEIETRNLDEISQVLEIGGVQRIMLDNFDIPYTERGLYVVFSDCGYSALESRY